MIFLCCQILKKNGIICGYIHFYFMETETKTDSFQSPRKSSFLFVVALLLAVATVGSGVYLSFAKTAVLNQQTELDSSVKSLEGEIKTLKEQKVESTEFAKKYLDDLQKSEIRWSKVLAGIRELVPKDLQQKPKIHFTSYSGLAGGKVALNAETMPAALPPYNDIIELLKNFNSSSFFRNAYISRVNKGLSPTGSTILTFDFNLLYTEELPTTSSVHSDQSSQDQMIPVSQNTSGQTSSSQTSQVPAQTSYQQQANAGTQEDSDSKVPRQ